MAAHSVDGESVGAGETAFHLFRAFRRAPAIDRRAGKDVQFRLRQRRVNARRPQVEQPIEAA